MILTLVFFSFQKNDKSARPLLLILDYIVADVKKKESRLFIIGETHYVKQFAEVKFELYKRFNSKCKVRSFIEERPLALQYFYSQYLESGDSVLLKGMLDTFDIEVPSRTILNCEFTFLKKMRTLNSPVIVCVDPIGSDKLYFQCASFILSRYDDMAIKTLLVNASMISGYERKFQFVMEMVPDIMLFLKPNDKIFLNDIIGAYPINKQGPWVTQHVRERFMQRKILDYCQVNTDALLVGQFGVFHADLSSVKKKCFRDTVSTTSLSSQLNNDRKSVFFKKVRTLLLDFRVVREEITEGKPILRNNLFLFNSDVIRRKYNFAGEYSYSRIGRLCASEQEKFFFSDLLVLDTVNSMVTRDDLDALIDLH